MRHNANSICRILDSVDGKWGALVDKETNSFNGFIGMVQRNVSTILMGINLNKLNVANFRTLIWH